MNETSAFAKLFIENGVPADAARAALNRLRRSAELTNAVATVVDQYAKIYEAVDGDAATFKRFYRQPQIGSIIVVACALGHDQAYFLSVADQCDIGKNLNPAPLVTGADLIALGLKPGPKFKEILFTVETEQLNGNVSTKAEAIEVALAVNEVLG